MLYCDSIEFVTANKQSDIKSQILMGGVVSQLVVAPFLVAPLERVKVLLQVRSLSRHN